MIWINIASWESHIYIYIYIIIWILDYRNGIPDHKPFTNVRRTFARHAKKPQQLDCQLAGTDLDLDTGMVLKH